ncbi:hypothetical protein FOZ63_020174 [Perkinsus olseni]|uniref:Uncharacterized protein n=1 Tax=Perkinsus olseni TaxID=32597 RepID=A0A7J6UI86_PEROL|nr:hypothetical protein FOZ63_020174 [Perkinsus olseni]
MGLANGEDLSLRFSERSDKKQIGSSLTGFSKSWSLPVHKESYYDPTLTNVLKDNNASKLYFSYDKFERTLSLALSDCIGDPAPLRLYAYSAFLPRPIADVIKTGILSAVLTLGELNDNADLLAWRKIQQSEMDSVQVLKSDEKAEEIKDVGKKCIDACREILKKADESLRACSGESDEPVAQSHIALRGIVPDDDGIPDNTENRVFIGL